MVVSECEWNVWAEHLAAALVKSELEEKGPLEVSSAQRSATDLLQGAAEISAQV